MLGQVYNVAPIAPDAEHTTYLDAGVLRLGVEYRRLDPEALADYYSGDDLAEVEEHSPEGGFTDEGVSIHIESVVDDHEYIRFDVFLDDPHYHYVDKMAGTNTLIGYDRAAHGEMLPWVLGQVANRLGPMLVAAGAPHVAEQLSGDAGSTMADQLRSHLVGLGFDELDQQA
ncbi:MAG: DUF7700 domain-containing protein [Acidimicrobiales bacterium]